ncbi:methyl-accepting chemotaxis protein [Paenibacillus sp. DS2015]|uniref:methyl-accepting chemotaxis protein n=1 Tax=Paenibacillus sp. DS2015 TaxID=3373917 RepID=UPI003D1DD1F5
MAVIISTNMTQRIVDLTSDILVSEKRLESVQRLNLFARTANDDGAHYLLAPEHLKGNFKTRFEADIEYLDKELVRLEAITSETEGKKQISKFKDKWNIYLKDTNETMALMEKGNELLAQQQFTRDSFDPISFSLLSFIKSEQAEIEKSESEIISNSQKARLVNYTMAGIAIVLSLIIAYVLSKYLTRRITVLKTSAQTVAEGNLAIPELRFKGKDELRDLSNAFNTMTQSLRSVISSAGDVSIQVAASSTQLQASAEQTSLVTEHIATIIQEINIGTEHQATLVEDNMSVITELSNNVYQIAANSQVVLEVVNTTSQTALQGKSDLVNAMQQVRVIEGSNGKLSEVIVGLNEQASQIEQAIQFIMNIAKQTEVLALNASIEAARAGEQGRGFAVVAREVRNLAEESKASAHQISDLVTGIQVEIDTAVTEMTHGTLEVQKGIQLIEVAGQSFEGIVSLIQQVQNDTEEVTGSTAQIMVNTEKVVASITRISNIAKENASGTHSVSASTEQQLASMEEISASSTSLASLAEELSDLIGKFKLEKDKGV